MRKRGFSADGAADGAADGGASQPLPNKKRKLLAVEEEEQEEQEEEEEEEDGSDSKVGNGAEDDENEEEEEPGPAVASVPDAKSGPATDSSGPSGAEDVTFKSLGLVDQLVEACVLAKWDRPTDIQREAIPYALQGRDIIGLAETGSGKTGSFALPILQALLQNPQRMFALVLAPTRELAWQIQEQFQALGGPIGAQTVCIIGGVDMVDQAIALAKKPHIIVATPGRIVDHLENTKGFHLKNLHYLVLDEADKLLEMDFEKEIDTILQVIPRERRTCLYSATMTSKVQKLQRASLTNPVRVEVSRKYQTVKNLVQQYLFIPAMHKDTFLTYVLNELAGNSVMIFTSTRDQTQRCAIMLRNLGFSAIPLHGKLTQEKRLGALNKFRAKNSSILIATDVASRGLDIPHVDVVINYDVPTKSTDYIHRVGRTARAGRSGRAITMVTQYDVDRFQRIEKLIQQKLAEFPVDKAAAMVFKERVSEAQRIATLELREAEGDKSGKKKFRRR